jgi:protein SCO1/2
MMNVTRWVVLVLTLGLIAGCDRELDWHSREISGLMPQLEFQLTGESGEPLTEQALRGQVVALFFGFTHCPDYCPATLQRLAQALSLLPEEQRDQVEVLFVSVDPERDTPAHLKKYTSFFGDNITGATGDMDELRALTKRYRTTFSYDKPDEDGDYLVSHGLAIYVFDRQGNVRLMMLDEGMQVEQMAADLEQMVEITAP